MANFGSSRIKDLVEAAIAEKERSKGKEFDEGKRNDAISKAAGLEQAIDRMAGNLMAEIMDGLEDIDRTIGREINTDRIADKIKENLLGR